jgi:alpha-beta hydrolase superfamily lysophospholipase
MNMIMVKARDGTQLACHQFSCEMPKARVFCLHGGSLNSRRYIGLAKSCQKAGYEMVICDWRGHGQSQGEPGTCQYQGQLEDDLYDIMEWFNQGTRLPTIIGGHSAGAVITLRYIEKYGQQKIIGSYFISPALGNFMEASRFDSDTSRSDFRMKFFRKKLTYTPIPNAARKHLPSFNYRLFWLAFILPFLRHKKILKFPAVKKIAELEGRVLDYSFNLMLSVSIKNYISAFRLLNVPTLFICGEEDEFLQPSFMPTVAAWHLAPELDKEVHMLPKIKHMTVISAASSVLTEWLSLRWNRMDESKL